MKKLLYSTLCLVASMAMFTACGDDDGGNSKAYSQTPAVDVAGTYEGEMISSYTNPSTNALIQDTLEATAELEANDTLGAYAMNLKQGAFGSVEAITAPVNVSATSSYYAFCNKLDACPFGAVAGTVTGIVLQYTYSKEATVRISGRPRKVTTTYTFFGTKE